MPAFAVSIYFVCHTHGLSTAVPGSQVNYKKDMPDIEVLMEAWPPEVEEIISNVNVLTPELDIPLEDYARMVRRRACSNKTMPRRIAVRVQYYSARSTVLP